MTSYENYFNLCFFACFREKKYRVYNRRTLMLEKYFVQQMKLLLFSTNSAQTAELVRLRITNYGLSINPIRSNETTLLK